MSPTSVPSYSAPHPSSVSWKIVSYLAPFIWTILLSVSAFKLMEYRVGILEKQVDGLQATSPETNTRLARIEAKLELLLDDRAVSRPTSRSGPQ